MGFNTRWDVSETKCQLHNRSAWNPIDAMMSARAASAKQTTTTQSGVETNFKIGGRL